MAISTKPVGASVLLKSPQDPLTTYYYDPQSTKLYYLWTSQGNNTYTQWREVKGSKKSAILEANAAAVTAGKEALNPATIAGKTIDGLGNVTAAPQSVTLRYPKDMSDVSDFVLFQFYDYKPPFGKGAEKVENGIYDYNQSAAYEKASADYKSIALYMPEDVSAGFRANWTGKSMSTMATDSLRAMGRDGFGSKAAAGVSAITNLAERMAPLSSAVALQAATKKLGGDALTLDDIFGSVSGSVLNPNTELLFNAIDMRNFQLNFKLVPRNAPEATDINKIIRQFQKAVLPERAPGSVMGFNDGGNNNTGVNLGFIGMPKLVRVAFMHRTGENKALPRFKMCAITNTDINYTPDGAFSTYNQGQPVAIGLSIGFQETKICFSEEIANDSIR
jgi:hypothetical protein